MNIEAVRIEGDRPISIKEPEVEDVVELVRSENFTWIDIQISLSDEDQLTDLLVEKLDFHPATVQDCLQKAPFHQPKMDEEQDYKFLSFMFYDEADDYEHDVRELNIYVSETYVITLHRKPITSFLKRFRNPPHHITEYRQRAILFLHHILDTVMDSYGPLLRKIENQSDQVELQILKGKQRKVLTLPLMGRQQHELSSMHLILRSTQSLVMFRRTLIAELSIIDKLISEYHYEGAPESHEEIAIYFRDITDHTRKYLEIIESEERTLNHLMEVQHLITGHRTNEIIYILTVISTVILPLNLIVGFFGMNFENLWFAHEPWGIWFISVWMLMIAIGLLAFFRHKGWI